VAAGCRAHFALPFPQAGDLFFVHARQRVSLHIWQKSQSLQACFRSEGSRSSGIHILPVIPLILIQGIGNIRPLGTVMGSA